MKLLKKLIDFYIYSSLHIAIAAVALTYQTALTLDIQISKYYYLFTFGATVFLYCLHRVIGINRMPRFLEAGRFAVIKAYRTHIQLYTIIGLALSAIVFFLLSHQTKLLLIIPGLFSLAYVLPIFTRKLRLRDFNYIKIFLIAIVWAYITVTVPSLVSDSEIDSLHLLLISMERFAFVFAITIPFDIRDIEIDKHTSVKTLVHKLGAQLSIRLAIILILTAMLINYNFMSWGWISSSYYYYMLAFYALLSLVIIWTSKKNNDYYFSGILDGTMILSCLFVMAAKLL